jgi:hypothetical protein
MDKGGIMADKDIEKRLAQLEKEFKKLVDRLSKGEKPDKKADKEAKKAPAVKTDAAAPAAKTARTPRRKPAAPAASKDVVS